MTSPSTSTPVKDRPDMLPTFDLDGRSVTRLICGGNPFSGYSHVSAELDWEMVTYYTMPRLQEILRECERNGINTFQSRGDYHQMRMYLEHQLNGGQMQWIAQTASELSSMPSHIWQLSRYKPIAIYHHGTAVDNAWHTGKIDEIRDVVKAVKGYGLPAGIGTHIPQVIEYAEEKGWETDFYMGCFYNLAKQYKSAPAMDQDAYKRDAFPTGDPARMCATLRQVKKPCLGFKIMAASRNCGTPEGTRGAFRFAFDNLKSGDGVVVGMFQKHANQVAENARHVREVLCGESGK